MFTGFKIRSKQAALNNQRSTEWGKAQNELNVVLPKLSSLVQNISSEIHTNSTAMSEVAKSLDELITLTRSVMFGFGKSKTQDVRLTEKEIRDLKKNMSRSELKEFEKRQKQAERDRFWDAVCMAELLDDD